MNKNKKLAKIVCVSMIISNITPAFATVTNETNTYDDTTQNISKETEVLYQKAGNYFVTIPKTISLGTDKQSPYSVKVEGDIPSDKQVYVSPIDGIKDTEVFDFYMHDTSVVNPKNDVVATVTQNKFYWNFSEVADGYSETNNQVIAEDLTSGHWKGTFDFEINMHKVEPEFTLTTDGDVTLPVGDSHQLNAYIDGVESNSDVEWLCDNEGVTINNGLIELPSNLEVGSELTITVSKDGKEVSFIITVSESISDFILTTDGDVTLPAGSTGQLNAYIDGVESNDDVTWSCDNSDITINNGFIEIPETVKAGTEITVVVSKNKKNISFTITVGIADSYFLAPVNAINNWNYTLNEESDIITLNYYIGYEKDVIVYANYPINGKNYKTQISNNIDNANYSTRYMFHMVTTTDNGIININSIKFSKNIDTSNVTNMQSMFQGCQSLTSLDISNFNTSNVTNMYGMFSNCRSLTSLDISSFDTRNAQKMGAMFNQCSKLKTIYVANEKWSTKLAQNDPIDGVWAMFVDCGTSSVTYK